MIWIFKAEEKKPAIKPISWAEAFNTPKVEVYNVYKCKCRTRKNKCNIFNILF